MDLLRPVIHFVFGNKCKTGPLLTFPCQVSKGFSLMVSKLGVMSMDFDVVQQWSLTEYRTSTVKVMLSSKLLRGTDGGRMSMGLVFFVIFV